MSLWFWHLLSKRQTMRTIVQIILAFSEKLNFNKIKLILYPRVWNSMTQLAILYILIYFVHFLYIWHDGAFHLHIFTGKNSADSSKKEISPYLIKFSAHFYLEFKFKSTFYSLCDTKVKLRHCEEATKFEKIYYLFWHLFSSFKSEIEIS